MGRRYHEGGRGMARSPQLAAEYLMSAARAGESGELLRKGFDRFVQGDYDAALKIYAEAAELGYEVGSNNAAYLLDIGVASVGNAEEQEEEEKEKERSGGVAMVLFGGGGGQEKSRSADKKASMRFHKLAAEESNAESFAAIGDSYYWGVGGHEKDLDQAYWWYSKAGVGGSIKGLYYCGFMSEFEKEDLDRAVRQYEKVLAIISRGNGEEGEGDVGMEMVFMVKFSIWRCGLKKREVVRRLLAWWAGSEEQRSLPVLPIRPDLGGEEEANGGGGEGGEGGDGEGRVGGFGKWLENVSSGLKKMKIVLRNIFLNHRGKVFGMNASEDYGYEVIWFNVVVGSLFFGIFVNVCRLAWRIVL